MSDNTENTEKKVIQIEAVITVGDLAKKLDIPVSQLIGELFKNGVMATVNEKLDFDTAEIVTTEINPDISLEKLEAKEDSISKRAARELSDSAALRPPVVAVMGHVDHGKTSLLDAIRGGKVAEGEAGGITQHISAYQIEHGDRKITFLDTPGHEAFAALREHGAHLTDVAIIVVAADDGIKPQTKEAIRFAERAGVKVVVAINKIDKPAADANRVKQQLSEVNLMPEEWGGDTVIVEVSAKTKQGIDSLLDMVLLVADVEELKADYNVPAEGIIIEAHMEQGRGAMATALVEHGTLKAGSVISAGATYAKVRTLEDSSGKTIKEAGPSSPVILTGFKQLPLFGEVFKVVKDEKVARQLSETHNNGKNNPSSKSLDMSSSDLIAMINKNRDQQRFNLIIKADVQGSLKSVIDSLRTLEHTEVTPRVIGQGVGNITENDIRMAASSEAIVYGFNVEIPQVVKQLAQRENVTLRVYKVIYELIDDVKETLTSMLAPELVETEVGRLIIKGVFMTTKSSVICGGEVTKGKVVPGAIAKVMRGDELIAEVTIEKVQRQQQEAKEVIEGEMCGLQLKTETKVLLEEGDKLELITREIVARKLHS